MRKGLRIIPVVVVVAVLAGCGSGDKASNDAGAGPTTVTSRDACAAQQVVDAVRPVQAQYGSRAIVYGAWIEASRWRSARWGPRCRGFRRGPTNTSASACGGVVSGHAAAADGRPAQGGAR